MSILVGHPARDQDKVSAQLEALGIRMLRAEPSSVTIVATPIAVQTHYIHFRSLLPAFMHATEVQTKVDATVFNHPVKCDRDRTIPMSLPNLAVSFSKPLPSQLQEAFMQFGYSESQYKGEKIHIFQNPTGELITQIMGQSPHENTASPIDTVNLKALPVLMLLRRLVSSCLSTIYYPAFTSEEHMKETRHQRDENNGMDVDLKPVYEKKRKLVAGPTTRSKKTPGVLAESSRHPDEDAEMEEREVQTGETVTVVARPSPKKKGFGQIGDIPNMPGVFFPFVEELAANDKTTVPSVIHKYFMGCLGLTGPEVKKSFQNIISSWGLLYATGQGRILTHIYYVLSIAILGQGRCFPIFDGESYVGSLICGWGITYHLADNSFVQPVTPDKLRENVIKYSRGPTLLRAIVNLVETEDSDRAERYLEDWSRFHCLGQLRLEMMKIPMTEATRDEVQKLLYKLSMPSSYWKMTPSNIDIALRLISAGSIIADLPVHPSQFFSKDVVEVVWSCFGAFAPTPSFPSVPMHDLKKQSGKPPTHIVFRNIVLSEAIADIKKILSTAQLPIASRNQGASGVYKNRIWEKKPCAMIVAAFEKAVGVVQNESTTQVDLGVTGKGADLFNDMF